MQINMEITRDVQLPKFSTKGSAGLDFYLPNDENIVVPAFGSVVIPLGVKLELPDGICVIMKERSSIAANHKLHVGACVIDSDYRGEIHAHLLSANSHDVKLPKGSKIIQGIFMMFCQPQFNLTRVLNNTDRGAGAFGSTDKQECSK